MNSLDDPRIVDEFDDVRRSVVIAIGLADYRPANFPYTRYVVYACRRWGG